MLYNKLKERKRRVGRKEKGDIFWKKEKNWECKNVKKNKGIRMILIVIDD